MAFCLRMFSSAGAAMLSVWLHGMQYRGKLKMMSRRTAV